MSGADESFRSDKDGVDVNSVLSGPIRAGEGANSSSEKNIDGIIIGELVELAEDGEVQVAHSLHARNSSLSAITTVVLTTEDVGRQVALSFVGGDPAKPVVMGVIRSAESRQPGKTVDVKIDDERLMLTADKEIVLQCGKASITLTRAGKIILKGEYVSTHSSGVNRIKGGSVQIN